MRFTLRIALVVCVLLWSPIVHAQSVYLGIGDDLTLSMSPQYPNPGDRVTITARSASADLSAADFTWEAGGKSIAKGPGVTSVVVTAGAIGSAIEVDAVVNDSASASVTIRPVQIDLLWEADSYVPPFFRGRALPSAGSNLRLEAHPHFMRSDGTEVPMSDIIFTWRKGSLVLGSVSGKGKYAATIPGPVLFGTDSISVEARSSDGLFGGRTSFSISSTEPIVALYRSDPLLGVVYSAALASNDRAHDEETTFVAVPYYLPAADLTALNYDWTINGSPLPNASQTGSITVSSKNSDGDATIGLSLSSAFDIFLASVGSWHISFPTSSGGSENPFNASQ